MRLGKVWVVYLRLRKKRNEREARGPRGGTGRRLRAAERTMSGESVTTYKNLAEPGSSIRRSVLEKAGLGRDEAKIEDCADEGLGIRQDAAEAAP